MKKVIINLLEIIKLNKIGRIDNIIIKKIENLYPKILVR
jgi:hypothetical protein